MMNVRPFRVPPTIQFGENAASEAGPEARRLGGRKVLVVTDSLLAGSGVIEPVLASLRGEGLEVTVFDGVNAEPTLEHVGRGLDMLKSSGCDIIVACGGAAPSTRPRRWRSWPSTPEPSRTTWG